DVAAVKTVGEIDLVDGAISPRPRFCEAIAGGGHSQHTATLCDEIAIASSCPGMEDGDAVHLFRGLDCPDRAAAHRSSWVAFGSNDHRHCRFGQQLGFDLAQPSARDRHQKLREVAL